MKQQPRIGLMAGALVLAFLFGGASVAHGEHERKSKSFRGTFRGPHGQFSISIGSPAYPVGSYAPYGYRVYRRQRYGYGFDTPGFFCRPHRLRHSHWIPVERYRSRWIVAERRYAAYDRYSGDPYYDAGYADPYSNGYSRGTHACWDACPIHHPAPAHACWDACPTHHPAVVGHVHSEDCGHDYDD